MQEETAEPQSPAGGLKPERLLGLSAFCSGAAALMYETLWARSLALMFGSTVQANAAIFAGFIIGLAIGAAAFGVWTRRSENPARLYGRVEFAIAVTGILVGLMLFHYRNEWIIGGDKDFLFLMRAVGSVVLLILIPAGLMGGTLPILLHLARRMVAEPGVIGRIYSYNVLGAALGALVCGFFAIPQLGLVQSHFAAGLLNVLAGALIIGCKLKTAETGAAKTKDETANQTDSPAAPHPEWFLIVAVFVSGFAVYAVEVLWSRLAHYFIGNRIFAFSILLSAVLCLLSIGARVSSILIRRYRRQLGDWLGFLVLASAAGVLLSALGSHELIFHQEQWEADLPGREKALLAYRFLETLIVLGPCLITLGILFPICLVLSKRSADDIAASTGRYYVLNAIGSVLGSLATGFFLLMYFGVYGSIVLLIWILVFAADLFFVHGGWHGRKISAGVGVGLGVLVGVAGMTTLPRQLTLLPDGDKLVHRLEDEYGIFQVAETPQYGPGLKRVTNNRTELVYFYGSKNTRRVQAMQGHLGMIYHPDAEYAAVLGSGYGITAGELSLYPQLKRIDAVEILPGMIAAADQFRPDNRSYHRQPNVRVVQDDGRHFIAGAEGNYDLVSINVSDPHTPGSGSLYHADFLKIIKSRLNPKGVVILHPFGADRGLQLRTVAHVFPHWIAFQSYGNGFNVVASPDPLVYNDQRTKALMAAHPEIGRSLRLFKFDASEALAREDLSKHFNDPHDICTDNRPRLEYSMRGATELLLNSNE
jgi:spermidine synthase